MGQCRLGHLLTVPVCRGEEGPEGRPSPGSYTPSSITECPRAPAAEPGAPGLTINRSGTENDQWLLTVYDYTGAWSPVCPIRSKLERDREQHGRQNSRNVQMTFGRVGSRHPRGAFFRPSVCSGPVFVAGPLAHGDRTAWLGWEDSNSEMSWQNIPLKDRTDFR